MRSLPSHFRLPRQGAWAAVCMAVMLAAVCSRTPVASAFYGRGKGSDVTLLDGRSFIKQVQGATHVWAVQFYREGCGYCQLIRPEWEKAANRLKHLVKFAAVDVVKTDTRQLRMGKINAPSINGVPTVKFYVPYFSKKHQSIKMKVVDYNGERKKKAMVNFALSQMPSFVEHIRGEKAMEQWMNNNSLPKVVLFSKKSEPSANLKALASEYFGKVKFAVVVASAKINAPLMSKFKVSAPPLLCGVKASEGEENLMWPHGVNKDLMVYRDKKITYRRLDSFVYDVKKKRRKKKTKKRKHREQQRRSKKRRRTGQRIEL